VSSRVSPTDRIRGEIDALFDGSGDLTEVLEDVARLGSRLIMRTAVEAEVDAFLGRARYQRVADCPDARPAAATATATPRSRPQPRRSRNRSPNARRTLGLGSLSAVAPAIGWCRVHTPGLTPTRAIPYYRGPLVAGHWTSLDAGSLIPGRRSATPWPRRSARTVPLPMPYRPVRVVLGTPLTYSATRRSISCGPRRRLTRRGIRGAGSPACRPLEWAATRICTSCPEVASRFE
jgi:hypothetical protein